MYKASILGTDWAYDSSGRTKLDSLEARTVLSRLQLIDAEEASARAWQTAVRNQSEPGQFMHGAN